MQTEILEIHDLCKTYHGRTPTLANDQISLTVRGGQVVGLLGHNGAGKTTLVSQVVGILKPDSGSITIDGIDAIAHPNVARELVSIQAQANVPITGLSPRNAIQLVGRIRGLTKKSALARADHLIEMLDMAQWANKPAQNISGGVARLTAFAMALAKPGSLVVLDEPTNDVDPTRRRLLWQEVRSLANQGVGVLLVTHNVIEAERFVDNLVILERGQVIAEGTPRELSARAGDTVTLSFEEAQEPLPGYMSVLRVGEKETVVRLPRELIEEAVTWANRSTKRFSVSPASLEDIYIELTENGRVSA